jgi:hypothetical protein
MRQQEFLDELEQELLAAARRRPTTRKHRRPARGAVLAVAACVATALFGAVLFRAASPAAAVEVTIDDNDVTLRLTDDDVDPDAIIEAAADADLDVQVVEVPVGPTNVGRFVRINTSAMPDEMRLLDSAGQRFAGFKIPRDWPGTLQLALGREARPGERYSAASDATAAGEPLECEPVVGSTLDATVDDLRSRGFTVRAFAIPTPGDVTDQLDQYRDWRVAKAEAVSPDEIYLNATPDGSWPYPDNGPVELNGC